MDEVLRLKCDLDEYDPAYDYGDDSFAVEHALRLPGPLPALPASRLLNAHTGPVDQRCIA